MTDEIIVEDAQEEIIDTRSTADTDVPHQERDREVKANLKDIFSVQGAYAWRFYTKSALLPGDPKKLKRRDGKQIDVYDPKVQKCPAYVKVNLNSPFILNADGLPIGNVRRCNHDVPEKFTGKSLTFYTIAHMKREHFEDWYEVNKRTHDRGTLSSTDKRLEAPPLSTQVEWPNWRTKGDMTRQDLTDFEKQIARSEQDIIKAQSKKEVKDNDAVPNEKVVEEKKKRGRPPKNKEGQGDEINGVTGDVS